MKWIGKKLYEQCHRQSKIPTVLNNTVTPDMKSKRNSSCKPTLKVWCCRIRTITVVDVVSPRSVEWVAMKSLNCDTTRQSMTFDAGQGQESEVNVQWYGCVHHNWWSSAAISWRENEERVDTRTKTRKPIKWLSSAKRYVTHLRATVVYNICYHSFPKRLCTPMYGLNEHENNTN